MNKPLLILIVTIAATALSGCQATKWSKESMRNLNPLKHLAEDKDAPSETEFVEPVRMAVMWSDGVYDEVGKPKVAGFGARIYFYNADDVPVKVDGELSVYGYEDEKQQSGHSADRKFVFRQSEFQSHFSETSLGNSYSVWIPWEKVGGLRKSISLIPIFKASTGKVLRGDLSVNVLPGIDPETNEVIRSEIKIQRDLIQLGYEGQFQNQVATAAYEQDVTKPALAPQLTSKQKRPSTTIQVPRSMASRLAAGQQLMSFPDRPKPKPKKQVGEKIASEKTSPPPKSEPKSEPTPIRTFGLPASW